MTVVETSLNMIMNYIEIIITVNYKEQLLANCGSEEY